MGYGLGVDLGTTFTAAAVVVDGRPDLVSLGDRAPEVPSVVFLREDGVSLVGEAALRRGSAQPDRLAREFKRRLGDSTPLVLGGHPMPSEALMGRLLRWVVDEVVERQGRPPERTVVTFPAIWGPFRREMLEHAIMLADVGRVELAPEPVAAALHFASAQRVPVGDTVAIYDLGGGTFDAAVLRHTERGFELLGTPTGLEHLGGLDFDEAVFRHVVATLADAATDLDPDDADVTEALIRLRRECTEAKEHLSVDTDAVVQVTLPTGRRAVRLTRGEFEEMIRPSVAETVASLRRALTSAQVTPLELSAVVLVGGSARVPLVAQMLGHDLGRPVTLNPAPKHAVALGAALLARGEDTGEAGRPGTGPRGAAGGREGTAGRSGSPTTAPPTTRSPPGPQGTPVGTESAPTPGVAPATPRGSGLGRRRVAVAGAVLAALIAVGIAVSDMLPPGRGADPESGPTIEPTADPAEPTIDPTPVATTVERQVLGTQVWTDTGVECAAGDVLDIAITGTIMHEQSPTGEVGPDGLTDPWYRQFNVDAPELREVNTVAVIGSLDERGPFFVVGSGTTHTCERDGVLHLGVNDAGVANNSGQFDAVITKHPAP